MPGTRAGFYSLPGSQKISSNFHLKLLLSFLRVLNVSLAMSNDLKNYFAFLVHEISEPGPTIKSFDT